MVNFDLSLFSIFLPFAKTGRPIRTFFLPFLDQLCAQTKMQQHIDLSMEISVLKFQVWPDKKPAFLGCISKRSTHIMVVTRLRLRFRSVGSGWQWISEGLNCVRFLFKFVTWKIGSLSHLNYIFLSCFSYAFVCVCLLMPCGPLLGKGWPLWLSFVMSNCEGITLQLVSWVRFGLDCIDSWSLPSFLLSCVSTGQHP